MFQVTVMDQYKYDNEEPHPKDIFKNNSDSVWEVAPVAINEQNVSFVSDGN